MWAGREKLYDVHQIEIIDELPKLEVSWRLNMFYLKYYNCNL